MRKNLILLIVLLLSCSIAMAQNTKKGDKAFERGEYFKAIEEYTLIVDNLTDPAERSSIKYKIAECYKFMNRPDKAEKQYVEAIKGGYMSSEIYFGYGDALLKLGKYDEAKKAFETYKRSNPDDKLADAKIASCVFAKANPQTNPLFTLQPLDAVNTRGSEYGIAYFNDALIYASTGADVAEEDSKNSDSKISLRTGLGYSKIYMSVPIDGVYGKGVEAAGLNTLSKTNEGTFAYDVRTKLGYYTRCENSDNQCYIYFGEYKNNRWVEKDRLPIDGRKEAIGHPCISPDGNRLYFTSRMEGGYGASDIWYIEKLPDGKWSKAINAGRGVNTVGDEVFPFVSDGYLFFASTGHPGYGGLDIFASKIEGNSHSQAVNIGQPFNTSQDDFNLIERSDLVEGMFVSSRRLEKSNDDIYRFQGFPHALIASGKVYDSISKKPLPTATIDLVRGGKVENKVTITDSGTYTFYVLPDTVYELHATMQGYTNKKLSFTTPNERFGKIEGWNMPMNRNDAYISGKVYDIDTKAPLANTPVVLYVNTKREKVTNTDANGNYRFSDIKENTTYSVRAVSKEYYADTKTLPVKKIDKSIDFCLANGYDMDLPLRKIVLNKEMPIENIFYDYDKATLRPESLVELDKLIREVLIPNPQFKLQINSHTDRHGGVAYNNKLSQARAQSVVDYLVSRGIDRSRFTAKGYGKSKLIAGTATKSTKDQDQKNRRTTFAITGLMDIPLVDTEFGSSATTITVPTTGTGAVAPTGTTQLQGGTSSQSSVSLPSSGSTSNPAAPYRIQVSSSTSLNMSNPTFQRLASQLNLQVFYEQSEGRYRYFVGGYNSREEAQAVVDKIKAMGIECFVKAK